MHCREKKSGSLSGLIPETKDRKRKMHVDIPLSRYPPIP